MWRIEVCWGGWWVGGGVRAGGVVTRLIIGKWIWRWLFVVVVCGVEFGC